MKRGRKNLVESRYADIYEMSAWGMLLADITPIMKTTKGWFKEFLSGQCGLP
jgi:hypothetical protein